MVLCKALVVNKIEDTGHAAFTNGRKEDEGEGK